MNHVEIQNLLRSDLREIRMTKLKKVITGEIMKMKALKINPESLSFNFSYPTISVPEMPVIMAHLNCGDPGHALMKDELAKNISASFREVVSEWRHLKQVKVKVEFCSNAGYYIN